jgi:hypothetical protein
MIILSSIPPKRGVYEPAPGASQPVIDLSDGNTNFDFFSFDIDHEGCSFSNIEYLEDEDYLLEF